ncbi:MAG: cyclic nucleotide-binding domain-containing protein [Proteobacteria bacterium]|nr:cyclic nucleotide-binding domain-containing protein [Pseudomonadota bacterium]
MTTITFVDHLSTEAFAWLSSNAVRRTVPAGGVLVGQGTRTTDLFLISAGLFEVTVATPSGGQQRISQLWPGAIIGEMSWLDGGPTSATIEALEPSEVLTISGAALDAKIGADPVFGSSFYRALAREAFVRLRAGNALLSKK